MKKECIIVDVDGTLANVEHRRKYLLASNNWEKFNSKMNLDSVNVWCRELINSFKDKYSIILVTGRSEEFRDVTLKWLRDNKIFYSKIFFRESNDYRDDTIVKEEIYEKNIRHSYDTLFVVDDRNKVVRVWRELGLICLQCDYGDF